MIQYIMAKATPFTLQTAAAFQPTVQLVSTHKEGLRVGVQCTCTPPYDLFIPHRKTIRDRA
jgi:hypothetical protein